MKELLFEILKEACTGKIIIDNDEWDIGFNSKVIHNNKEIMNLTNDRNNSQLIISDLEKFLELLEIYISEELKSGRKVPNFIDNNSKLKWIITYLFINATTEDLLNVNNYIKRRITFLKDTTFDYYNEPKKIKLSSLFNNSSLEIKNEKNAISMETPAKISLKIVSDDNEYLLPSIYYGIDKDTCYIYSLMNKKNKPKNEQEKKYQSQINRLLYKINNGVTDEELKDVTMSFVLASNIFISLLQRNNIKKVKVVSYLPIRYLSRDIKASENEYLKERNELIQNNITNKLIRTFKRIAKHNKDINIELFPYELDEFLTIYVDKRNDEIDNILLEETNRKINNTQIKK